MSRSSKSEQRFLSADELDLVAQSHHPALRELGESDLQSLVTRLRERRDRARDIAHRQRREMRGKAQPAGAQSAGDDSGTRMKKQLLAAALKRANKERERRRRATSARERQVASARRALALKRASAGRSHRPESGRTAGEGMHANPNERAPDLSRPMEVGRVSQFVRDAQARRDSR